MTLGCAKNQVDTEFMLGSLMGTKYLVVTRPDLADAVVINTCCFIDAAKEETVNTILEIAEMKKGRPELKLIVAGCAAQKYGKELLEELPEIDVLLGVGELGRLKEALDLLDQGCRTPLVFVEKNPVDASPGVSRWGVAGPSAYLKIADGCDNRCTYCVIPKIKGPYRSRPVDALIEEAQDLAARGVKELCLVAQDVTAYGLDIYGELRLPVLLRQLVKIEALRWIRLLYCYPTYITDELLQVISQERKICRYMDIPIQHGSTAVLRRMGRRGDRAFLENLLAKIRNTVPDIAIRTTFIVGFPGETEAEFQELLDFMQQQRFQWAGVFTYSQEPETPAAGMREQVPEYIKEERYHRAMMLQREITLQVNDKWLGRELEVLVEGVSPENRDLYVGRAYLHAPEVDGQVYFTSPLAHRPGDMAKVLITDVAEYDLVGEMIE
ncbi:MAG TPA: 30S ribosomal protein S12 methylthiotransferase RimO [Clostridia bacterium]|nr:30S ribosomal protein S12 methylthiotransferase RimO [Clostridia bacterium]